MGAVASYFASLSLPGLFARIPAGVAQGLVWGLMALGVYITFRLLDIADLSVDGTFSTGSAVVVMLILSGVNPWAATLIAMAAGLVAGTVTGLLHTKLGIPAILSGILTQYALYSINLAIMGFKANQAVSVDKYAQKGWCDDSGTDKNDCVDSKNTVVEEIREVRNDCEELFKIPESSIVYLPGFAPPSSASVNPSSSSVSPSSSSAGNESYETVRYEAEAANCTGCTEKTNDAASGGKYMRTETTGNITFNISVPAAGKYEVVIRFSNTASNAKTQDIHVNGTKVKSQEFPVTLEGNLGGAAAAFEDMPVQVSLNAGANTFAIIKNWGHVDVDYIEVKVPGGSTLVAGFTPVAGAKFHVQVSGRNVHVSGTDGAPVAIMDMQGRVLRSGYLQGRRGLDFQVERAGSYLVRAGSAVHRVNIAR